MAVGMLGYPMAAVHQEGGNRREKLLRGVWYMFYSKLSIDPMGP